MGRQVWEVIIRYYGRMWDILRICPDMTLAVERDVGLNFDLYVYLIFTFFVNVVYFKEPKEK